MMFCKIYSDVSKVTPKVINFYNSSRFYQTHYDVLNLSKNCSAKEIKNAFIKLSKEHHPDVNKSEESHVKFQKINEAYKVLGKAESRRHYDLGLIQSGTIHARKYYNQTYYEQGMGRNPHHDPLFWVNRDKSKDDYYKGQPYYGINGVPRLSNGAIMIFCIFFALLGASIQFLAISHSMTFKRETLKRQSLDAEQLLKISRDAATVNGNPAQLEALKTKLLGNAMKVTDDE